MKSMNFYGQVMKSSMKEMYNQVYPKLLFTKIALGLHFLSEISWLSSVQIYRIFYIDWYSRISFDCFFDGCIWPNISLFIFNFFAYYLLFFAFGILIYHFTNFEASIQRKSYDKLNYALDQRIF